MKQAKIIQAYKVLNNISQQKLPLSVSYKLWTIARMLQPQWEFQKSEEAKVIEKYNPVMNDDGSMSLGSEERAKECKAEYEKTVAEIAEMDIDLGEFKKVALHLDDNIDISIVEIEALSEFVDFVE